MSNLTAKPVSVTDSESRSRNNRRVLLGVGTLVFVIGVLVVSLLISRAAIKRRLEAQIATKIAAIRLAGEPVTAQDLDKLYHRLPDAENSALIYLQASSNCIELDLPDENETNSPLIWVTNDSPSILIPADTKTALQQWLGSNSTALALIHKAALVKEGSYPLDLSRGFTESETLTWPKSAVSQLSEWEAILAAEDDHPDAAFKSLMDSFGLARSFQDHPYPIAQYMRGLSLLRSSFALERVLNRTRLNDEQLRELEDSFHQAQQIDWIKRSILVQRGIQLEVAGLLPKPPVSYLFFKHGEDRAYALWHVLLYPQRNMADYLNIMEHYIATASLPIPQRLAAEIEIAAAADSHSHSFSKWFPPPPNWCIFTTKYARVQATIFNAEVAIAVERYRLANNGQIPDELKSLVPVYLATVPVGPADGKPLRFKKRGNSYVISTSYLKVDYNETNHEELTFTVER